MSEPMGYETAGERSDQLGFSLVLAWRNDLGCIRRWSNVVNRRYPRWRLCAHTQQIRLDLVSLDAVPGAVGGISARGLAHP